MINSLMCKLGRHHRSRSKVKRSGDAWVSKCRHCGISMRRSSEGVWSVDAPAETSVSASHGDLVLAG